MTAIERDAGPVTIGQLHQEGVRLNDRYFRGMLPAIPIEWSRRLTASAGMFLSRVGPRARLGGVPLPGPPRVLRLSLPLLQNEPYREVVGTLAHEMIHQWQYDILKRRPNHGAEFLRKMTEMNRNGALAITIYHTLQQEVLALMRFAWRCRQCGRVYRRQRRTIQPKRHHCGICRGSLQELGTVSRVPSDFERSSYRTVPPARPPLQPLQLSFTF